jgi:cysteine desulfurase / selenocysteine lyase
VATAHNTTDTATAAEPLSTEEVARIRAEFPVLRTERNGRPLVYLDNAATSQKPQVVIDATRDYYELQNSNVHRGVHYLSQVATEKFEKARIKAKHFFNSPLSCEVIYTRGATEGINLVAHSYGRTRVGPGDEILISTMEHHSNIVPWQILCEEKRAHLRVIPVNDAGELVMEEFDKLLNEKTKLVSIVHVSNALGTVNPVKEIIEKAHSIGVPVLLDAAQSAPHMPVDVQELDCDFFVCSGHKMMGPTGIGIFYGKAEYLNDMPPFLGGGDMILSVTFEKTTYNALPYKFEAGTPNIAGAVGLGAAIDYLTDIGMDRIAAYEHHLLQYGTEILENIDGVHMIGTARDKAGVLSFIMDAAHPHDIGQVLDDHGIAIRAGHHCAQPVMQRFGVPATARASLAFYNTKEELDALGEGLRKVIEVFG